MNLPKPNLGGRDWMFRDDDGNELVIDWEGAVCVEADDDWIELSREQWRLIAAIAAHFAEEH